MAVYDIFQTKHAILRNFPIIGHFRYWFEAISPEIQQYFIERRTDGTPFSRNLRTLAYERAKNLESTHPFGTELDLNRTDYDGLEHSIYPKNVIDENPRIIIGGKDCKKPYSASIYNISAMSFGALSNHAVIALNRGAKKGNFYHNTGEGGISQYHLEGKGDLVWQVGTGYFGCRTANGGFDEAEFAKKAAFEEVKMIELKISQGAKPGHGGILPGVKNTPEIAKIRGIKPYQDAISPPGHQTFHNAETFVKFIARLRELAQGKPVGFKLCIGKREEFEEICAEMKKQNTFPDFITVDGAEGGTGAAPLEYSDSVGVPLEPALVFVHNTLVKLNIRKELKLIVSGKMLSAYSIIKMLSMGADACNAARGFLFSLGCIQALRCNTNECPTGVATQNKMLMKGLNITDKAERVYQYHKNTVKVVMELFASTGIDNLDHLTKANIISNEEMDEVNED